MLLKHVSHITKKKSQDTVFFCLFSQTFRKPSVSSPSRDRQLVYVEEEFLMYGEDSCPHEYGRKQLNALKTEIYCLHVCVDGKTDKRILKRWAHTRGCLVAGTCFRYYCSPCSKSLTRPNEGLVSGVSRRDKFLWRSHEDTSRRD